MNETSNECLQISCFLQQDTTTRNLLAHKEKKVVDS